MDTAEKQSLHALSTDEKKTFIEMLDEISQQNYLENDRLGWLLTRVLTEYYSKSSGINIDQWLDNVNGEVQLKLILLLMSQEINPGEKDRFPDLKFLINRYKE